MLLKLHYHIYIVIIVNSIIYLRMCKINTLIRTDTPEIIGLPSKLAAVEGQAFSFPSHVTGKPVPDVYWYLNSR